MGSILQRAARICADSETLRMVRVRKFPSAEGLLSGAESLLSLGKFTFTKNFSQTSVKSVTQPCLLANSCQREEKKVKTFGYFQKKTDHSFMSLGCNLKAQFEMSPNAHF